MGSGKKERLDRLLVARGLASSRQRAQAMILSGRVSVEGYREDKAGKLFPPTVGIQVAGPRMPYVSRGGVKLEAALAHFGVTVAGRVVLDVGASTGGFTDCLLQHGARKVFAVDVGYGQLDLGLRRDPRVVVLERRNIRYLRPEELDEPAQLATVDVSFISLRIVLPAVKRLLTDDGEVLALLKPQFEVGRREVGRGGVVKDAALHRRVIGEITEAGSRIGLRATEPFPSPVRGPKGNQEYFLLFR